MPVLVNRLKGIEGYMPLFERAYPGEGVNEKTIAKAIATFERTLVTSDSDFDRWQRGDAAALVRAVETHPDWMPYAWRGLAEYQAAQKNFRVAMELVRRYGESPALPPVAQNSSIDQLRQALHANPDNYGLGFQLYHAQMEQGLLDEALLTVRHFTDLPGAPRYFHFLEAEAWAAKGDWGRAWKAREKFDAAQ